MTERLTDWTDEEYEQMAEAILRGNAIRLDATARDVQDAASIAVQALRDELGDAVDQARLFNRGAMSWLEYDTLLVRWEKIANASNRTA